ncbi:hypothetical protein QN372_12415 [Undibacterium sp. RTI2.1]|uniref:hypothetical protein n=1 Tax=unclassified Undibacterium TaxID=2630295 RepID=UPI002AB55570|nr:MULTISPECIES: hypothetical protein [unclassified Undibacterium]MDY7538344.1 hypothetical protein [Undibacterium sp. 5I1]MEB0031554.1 hypothetical protein [Undibacterium sp. RTI2.1]MEB0115032.1 hypothetical protein [Undibacterium sp. RTI2.2]MEB0229381.1 hypothetical protein [Undibacterium sp. 10I3]MEB0255991.1 hypothetical protein [Undibacterium sp. 5I1]
MLKKSTLFGLSVLTLLASTAFSEYFVAMAIATPVATQSSLDATPASTSARNVIMLERGGMDRASVHLQILQQTNTHFADSNLPKKSATGDKKMQSKPANNS